MNLPPEIVAAAWRVEQLGECLSTLLQRTALANGSVVPEQPGSGLDLDKWVRRAAEQLGSDTVNVETTPRDLENQLLSAAPALLAISPTSYLAIVAARRGRLICLQPTGGTIAIESALVCDALASDADSGRRERLARALQAAKISQSQRRRVLQVLTNDTAGSAPFHGCWTFRSASGRQAGQWIRNTGVVSKAVSLLVAHSLQYGLWLISWGLLGKLSFSGRLDRGWLLAWALLLATAVPCRALATWLQGVIPILLGGELKRRVLTGALKLAPDEIRKGGIGSFLSQALEVEALESLALGGGIAGLLAIVDLAVSAFVLGRLAILLLFWFTLAAVAALVFMRRFGGWSGRRLEMTHDLVEVMVGHRTRLAQLHPRLWHQSEDQALASYLTASCAVDHAGAFLVAAIPRGWLLAAFAYLAPQIVKGQSSGAQLAILVGGILLAFSAFDRLTSSSSEIAAAFVAWRRIGFLFRSAERTDASASVASAPEPAARNPILEGERLEFRYREHGPAVLESCNISIWPGDRVLLEGASGGGKTTLAALLSGSRQPQSGLLLNSGLDIRSLGAAGWRDRVVSAPQFHDNHILTETLAFNLLMGRRWPAGQSDFDDAEAVCRQLGLGGLLDRMPSGLLQMVGDGGWQLSHGERSRIFIARALLQNPELIILDESFGSLDPETLASALEFTLDRAKSLIVIAHP